MNDTIFALASAPGKAGVSVFRVSGPSVEKVFDVFGFSPPEHRKATLVKLEHGRAFIDDALALYFQGPRSFTGEDVLELHTHGSNAVTKSLMRILASYQDFRLAEPGEFTRRALENNKLDLTQVEGLADLIQAETELQREQANRVLSGGLSKKVQQWRTDLIRSISLLEATIDFADEDVPIDVTPEVRGLISGTIESLDRETKGTWAAERVRDGFEVAIVGRPNSGKSSLLNFLAGREAAITSDVAGTTRDVIEVQMDIGGIAVTLLDTAGLRDSQDAVEVVGIERARGRAAAADLRVVLVESKLEPLPIEISQDDIVLVSKSDLNDGDISTVTGQGIDALLDQLQNLLSEKIAPAGLSTNQRQFSAMDGALVLLRSAESKLDSLDVLSEVVVDDLRLACRKLDVLIGRIDVENFLDEIFSSFCIGK